MNTNLDKIEKLIIDGNKEVINRIERLEVGQKDLEIGQKNLEKGMKNLGDRLEAKIDRVDKKHDVNTEALYGLLQDVQGDVKSVREDVNRIEVKFDAHMRQPAHA